MAMQEAQRPDLMLGFTLGRAIKEFAKPVDVKPRCNPSITWFSDSTNLRTCYRRGEFVPSKDNEISAALRAHEEGNRTPLIEVAMEVRARLGMDMQLQSDPILEPDPETGEPRDTGKALITHLILLHGGEVDRVCGFSV